MKTLLSISYTLIVVFFIGTAQVNDAAGQDIEKAPRISTNSSVANNSPRTSLGRTFGRIEQGRFAESIFADAPMFGFTSSEFRLISGRYASEGSNVYSQALRESWEKLNSRVESQRPRVLIP